MTNSIIITCPMGLSVYLASEVKALGYPVIEEARAMVRTDGSFDDAMRLNLHLRTAHRVLVPVAEFQARDAEELYEELTALPWEEYIPAEGYLSVMSSVDNPTIRDTRFANLKCKDAIVDRIKQKRGTRPDSGNETTGAVVNLYWKGKDCIVSLDTSGEPLSKRGYRKLPLKAPMQESLAAAVVMATGWAGDGPFINPMCGSGTLAIEAALIALDRPPGATRLDFGFMHLLGYSPEAWKKIKSSARQSASPRRVEIIATDHDPRAIDAARRNAETAGVERNIQFGISDFRQTPLPPDASGGVVVMNPEYGIRMGSRESLGDTYKAIGDFFKQRCAGYRGFVFTGEMELAKSIGLKPKRRHVFYNGPVECRLLEYELYSGTREPRASENVEPQKTQSPRKRKS